MPDAPTHGIHDTAPAARWEDAYLGGNGRHGVLVHGRTEDERLVITHHDLVRPDPASGAEPPLLAPVLAEVQDALLAGRQAEAVAAFGGDWEPRYVQSFHPGFAVRVRRPAAEADGYRRTLDLRTGVAAAEWHEADGWWRCETFVSRADDVVVHLLTAPSGGAVEAEVCLDTRLPGAPEELRAAVRSVYRPAEIPAPEGEVPRDTALLRLRVRYPDSELGYRGATRLLAPGGTVRCDGPRVHVSGARQLLLLTRTARGPVTEPDGCLGRLDTGLYALSEDYELLLQRHLDLHTAAYDRVALDLHAPAADRELPVAELLARQEADPSTLQLALLESLFAAGRYHLLASSGARPPRLCGLWTGDWASAWGGAFTTNANLNLQLAGAAATGLPEASLALAALVRDQLPDWRTNARRLYGTRGAVAPAHTDGTNGLQYHFNPSWAHHLWTAGADWLLHPLLEHAETTGDTALLTGELLPALLETAAFYEDFLTRTGPDGRIAIVPSYSPENHPVDPATGAPAPAAASVNATMDVAAARHALTTAADLADRHRAAPAARTAGWRALAARLPDYRVNEDGALAEWAWPGHRDGYDHRHVSHLYPVWPLGEIAPDTTPGLAAAARAALLLRGDENHSGHGHLHRALAAARLDDAGLLTCQLAHLLVRGFFFRSLMSSHYPDRDVFNADVAHALPGVLTEMLLRSRPGRPGRPAHLTVLPALPAALPSGRLTGARTRFGAVVEELSWSPEQVTLALRAERACTVELRIVPLHKEGGELLELAAGRLYTVTVEL
ncbi:glycosyl hydrolase family 95 catalytic domain-containing protein [Streptomyces sp. NRRL B-24484]|uniref:glycosyl hydrolase family 95 catalytic domain-containing protein n=1 Tax=Streptomyces sp. NRRL B-24484 TaxID=1463833 RepID=UPI0004BEC1DC|nr:glycoside hydrolase N-terminal domain-containing protein [Streptomyces sp. NRRL B-24484]